MGISETKPPVKIKLEDNPDPIPDHIPAENRERSIKIEDNQVGEDLFEDLHCPTSASIKEEEKPIGFLYSRNYKGSSPQLPRRVKPREEFHTFIPPSKPAPAPVKGEQFDV